MQWVPAGLDNACIYNGKCHLHQILPPPVRTLWTMCGCSGRVEAGRAWRQGEGTGSRFWLAHGRLLRWVIAQLRPLIEPCLLSQQAPANSLPRARSRTTARMPPANLACKPPPPRLATLRPLRSPPSPSPRPAPNPLHPCPNATSPPPGVTPCAAPCRKATPCMHAHLHSKAHTCRRMHQRMVRQAAEGASQQWLCMHSHTTKGQGHSHQMTRILSPRRVAALYPPAPLRCAALRGLKLRAPQLRCLELQGIDALQQARLEPRPRNAPPWSEVNLLCSTPSFLTGREHLLQAHPRAGPK